MSNFKNFAKLVSKNLDVMYQSGDQLFLAKVSKDDMKEVYLESYPTEVNQIFRERRHYDCNEDLNFVTNLGRVVTISDGEIKTVWDDINTGEYYDIVAKTLSAHIKSCGIDTIFATSELSFGSKPSIDNYDSGIVWHHFFHMVKEVSSDVSRVIGNFNNKLTTFKRSLEDLTLESAETILDLICSNSIYRGEEYKDTVEYFISKKKEYNSVENKELWLFLNAKNSRPIRNSVIGSLMLDLVAGVDLESAVKSFEKKVAPENYKRPSAVVTKGMIKKAEEVFKDKNLIKSLDRRCAISSDISVNDVLFADRSIQKDMKDGTVFDQLLDDVKESIKIDPSKTKKISVTQLEKMLPKLNGIKAYVENLHTNNFMTLIAPVHMQDKDRNCLTPWVNEFTWSYNGDLADSSLKERVSKAGGNVDGDVRVSLGWTVSDDYDLSIVEPNLRKIYFGDKISTTTGGQLDVDANAQRIVKDPVENIFYKDKSKLINGKYEVFVHNYNARSNWNSSEAGFTLEVAIKGSESKIYTFDKPLRNNQKIQVCTIVVKNGKISVKDYGVKSSNSSTDVYGISTMSLVPVTMIMNSPNHWADDVNVGNKHTFFILDKCKTEESLRGFYNEFLRPDLHEIRKTTEILGSRMRVNPTGDQLSGLGFSHTKDANLTLQLTHINGKVDLVTVEFNK